MPSDAGYFGYGTRAGYVRYMLKRGLAISQVAESLQTSIYELIKSCPDIDFYQYPFFDIAWGNNGANRYTNDEIMKIIEHYGKHGSEWVDWRVYLPGRTKASIRTMAGKLGVSYVPKGKR